MSAGILHEDIGSRKPSHFLRHLKFMGGEGMSEIFIKCLWVRRLPEQVQMILAVLHDKSLEEQAEAADAIMDVIHCNKKDTEDSSVQQQLEKLKAEVEQLKVAVAKLAHCQSKSDHLNGLNRGRSQSRSGSSMCRRSTSRNRYQRSPSRANTGRNLCWYHEKFGDHADYCVSPCSFYN